MSKRLILQFFWLILSLNFAFSQENLSPSFLLSVIIDKTTAFTRLLINLPNQNTYKIQTDNKLLRLDFKNIDAVNTFFKTNSPDLAGYTLEKVGEDAVLSIFTPYKLTANSGFRIERSQIDETFDLLTINLSQAFADNRPIDFNLPKINKKSEKRYLIVLDPGHGGSDPGAIGFVIEKNLVLDVAKRVRYLLWQAGIDVIMTRESDNTLSNNKDIDLSERTELSDNKTAFISIHANAATRSRADQAYGIEVYFYNGKKMPEIGIENTLNPLNSILNPDYSLEFKTQFGIFEPNSDEMSSETDKDRSLTRFGNEISVLTTDPSYISRQSEVLANDVLISMVNITSSLSRGVKKDTFYVIKNSKSPAILIELGFLTRPIEGGLLNNPDYLDRISFGIAQGIFNYLQNLSI